MEGPILISIYSLFSVLLAYWSMTLGLEGWLNGALNIYKRLLSIAGSIFLLIPPLETFFQISGFYLNGLGLILLALIYLLQGKLNFNYVSSK